MQLSHLTCLAGAAALILGGCGGAAVQTDTTASGSTQYKDASTDSSGAPRQPARPSSQPASDPMRVAITVEGSGDLSGVKPSCSLTGATGAFHGLFSGHATIDGSGLYLAALSSSEATFQTPGGCKIPSIDIKSVSKVVVRGELSATTQNCSTYCAAKSRSYAEGRCGAGASAADCRAQAESSYSASCSTACRSDTHTIVAETALSASAIAKLDASGLTGAGLGDLSADLVFDHVENGSGDTVNEAP